MRTQLDILALEPFYGGIRRAMLSAVIGAAAIAGRCSSFRRAEWNGDWPPPPIGLPSSLTDISRATPTYSSPAKR